MFGYVSVYKDELKMKEYDIFKAYYCGLCKTLGKRFNQAVRMGLSYDMTFLALLLSSVGEDSVSIQTERCVAHWVKKRGVVQENPFIQYAADMSILLTYYKLADDWADEKSIKALLQKAFYLRPARKVKKQYSSQCQEAQRLLEELSTLERQNCIEVDRVADCFGNLTRVIFTPTFLGKKDRRILGWLGYHMGRWIYILDAINDLEEDRKKKQYNPFLAGGGKDTAELTLTLTLESIASSYELLNVAQNDGILRNIIYFGLRARQDFIIHGGNDGSL